MEKEEMIKNIRNMMRYADDKMKSVVKEEVKLMLERDAFSYIMFHFIPKSSRAWGACIEFGSWGGTYNRLYADQTEEYGGWCGASRVESYENTPQHVTRDDMMRMGMIMWGKIKERIEEALAKELAIDNFEL